MYSGTNTSILTSVIPKTRDKPMKSRQRLCAPAAFFRITEIEGGFPHSEILGSKPVRSSPRLIAAYHVLHRLSAPRHPPNALMTLDCSHYRRPPRLHPSAETKMAAAPDRNGRTTIEKTISCF